MSSSDSYTIQLSGTGVSEADAQAAFEACVTALRTATAVGGTGPFGELTHDQVTEEQASDVA